ncbi:hypothetical protein C8F04DRAFT_1228868 [Mycena alexandri]|uniref:Rho termination factor N-terminal domain-containing protein n=1 Tax=Mycena alexandri TaxID=1745969 RepID=A0AAD6TE39_9AGAR|nr:hypothetical protein C8F04DRAFT_1228868 [Mycena alexandri]
MSTGPDSEANPVFRELKKLTVPQLKALCKEKRVTGYSKLGKDAIIQKLLQVGISAPSSAPSVTAPTSTSAPAVAPTATPVPASDKTPIQNSRTQSSPTPSSQPPTVNPAPEGSQSSYTPARVDAEPAPKPRPKKLKNPPASQDALPPGPSTSDTHVFKVPAVPQRPTLPDSSSTTAGRSSASTSAPSSSAPAPKKTKKAAAANKSIALTSTDVPPDTVTSDSIRPPAAKKRKTGPATDSIASPSTSSSDTTNPIPPTTTAPREKKTVPANSIASTSDIAPSDDNTAALSTTTTTAVKKKKAVSAAASADNTDTIPASTTTVSKKKKTAPASPTTATKKKKTVPADQATPSITAPIPRPPVSTVKPVPAPRVPSTASTQSTPPVGVTNPLPKRPSTALPPTDPPPPKKQKIAPPHPPSKPPTASKFLLPKAVSKPPVASKILLPEAVATPAPALIRSSVVPQDVVKLPQAQPKRFVPLVVAKKPPLVVAPPSVATAPIIAETSVAESLYHLDFPVSPPPPALTATRLPPSLSQRKRVPRFSLLLIYLSAFHRLNRNFAGKRLTAMLKKYPQAQAMTNMWPYLKQRTQEVSARKREYSSSFLGRLFPLDSSGPISEQLWTSPDDERQIVIALRFLLTRLFFQVSVGGGKEGKGWSEGQIVDAQQLVKDEVWMITVRHSATSTESFYVLESTCEPLTAVADSATTKTTAVPVRADWSAYIAHRASTPSPSAPGSPASRLMDHLSWTNHEEYQLGISRLWLKRIEAEGETGTMKRITAERYIFACVVGNSLSGRYMSATQMAQDFAGLPDVAPARVKASPKVNLFLPAHHHVESVHFTASNRRPLHSALAIVQTPGRIYFILRDNGMQVGCEEEGVADVWMSILCCENSGVASRLRS